MTRRSGILLVWTVLAGLAAAGPAAAQEARLVALVVSVGEGAGRADAVQGGFEALGAETLRADDPNNAEMRSLLMRFADVAENRAVALIYLDAPVARFGERDFVLPAGVALPEANDLLTRTLPLSAFARAAAVAGEGGAVFVAANGLEGSLPSGIEAARRAPEQRIGMTPIALATGPDMREMVQALAGLGRDREVELGELMGRISARPAASVSAMPDAPVFLGTPPGQDGTDAAAAEAATGAEAEAGGGTAAMPAAADPASQDRMSTDALAALEQALSRSAKRRLQQGLRARGHYSGLIDGIIGDQTRSAIRSFQQAEGAEMTGYLTQSQILRLQQP